MKRDELEKHLGKNVKIVLFDGTELRGELHKTGEEMFKENPNLYLPKNYYFLAPQCLYIFRTTHVGQLKEI